MDKYNWDLESLLKGQTIDQLFNHTVKAYKELIKLYPDFYKSIKNFRNWIKKLDDIKCLANRMTNYVNNKHHENLIDPTFLGWRQKISQTFNELSNQMADYHNVIIKNKNIIRKYLKAPDLKIYSRGFELIFRDEPHTLSPEVEKALDKASNADGGVYQAFVTLTDSDLKFKDALDSKKKAHPIKTATDAFIYLKNKDRTLRKNAWINFHEAYGQYENTLTQTLYYTYLKFNTDAKLYNFKDYVEASAYDDEVSVEFIKNIYKHVKNFGDIYDAYSKKVKKLLCKQLKIKKLEPWDGAMDLASNPVKISIPEAQKLILESFKPLGKEYCTIVKKAFNENWISWLPKQNKQTGAYSISGVKGLDKYFILSNYDYSMNGVETIAHELGHSMHSYYSVKNNKEDYCEVAIFYAEIASICVETLLLLYLLDKYKKDQKQVNFYIKRIFDGFFAATTRQIIFSNFEYIVNDMINNKKQIDAKTLKDIYLKLIKEYEDLKPKHVKKLQSEPYNKSLSTILRIPHFYSGEFYVYKYAIGQICGLIMANKIYQGDTKARDQFIKFLSSGSSLSPLETIKILGIDLNKNQPYLEAKNILKNLLKRFK
ncbi:MAG: oligoendopeptidase F [Mycoplasma sp.]